jgi:hypothetical protein
VLRSIGVIELAVLLVLPIIIVLFASLFGGRIRSLVIRISEASAFRRANRLQRASSADGADPRTLAKTFGQASGFIFPRAFAVAVAVSGAHAWFFIWLTTTHSALSGTSLDDAAYAAGDLYYSLKALIYVSAFVCVLRAVYLHLRPSHDRRTKYDYLLAGASVGSLHVLTRLLDLGATVDTEMSLDAWLNVYTVAKLTVSPVFVCFMLFAFNPAVWLLIFFLLTKRWIRGRSRTSAQTSTFPSRRTYNVIRVLPLPVLLVIGHPFVLPYLWLRFLVFEAMAERPIIYLRAFRYVQGPTAFGRIVFKVARRFSVIVAIVHQAQRGSALMRHTSILEQPRTALLPDDRWQTWVVERLKTASAVIIDATVQTDALAWELDHARSVAGLDRTCVLIQRGGTRPEEVFCLEYELDRRSVKAVRTALKQWLSRVSGISAQGTASAA